MAAGEPCEVSSFTGWNPVLPRRMDAACKGGLSLSKKSRSAGHYDCSQHSSRTPSPLVRLCGLPLTVVDSRLVGYAAPSVSRPARRWEKRRASPPPQARVPAYDVLRMLNGPLP
jgi:hypothetical protein